MSFEEKYSWQILTQYTSVVEFYYRLGLLDASYSQDKVSIERICERNIFEEGYVFMKEWGGMKMDEEAIKSHFIVQVERKSLHALAFFIQHRCPHTLSMAMVAYSYYRKGLEDGLKVSQQALDAYVKRYPSLEVHILIIDRDNIKRMKRDTFIQEIALEMSRIQAEAEERMYEDIKDALANFITFVRNIYLKEKEKRWEYL